jgi:DHA2 family multidrug resistance protein-like MFS transporter
MTILKLPTIARPTDRPWRGMALLLLPTALVAVDINVLFLALPTLSADLRVGPVGQLWIIDVYGLVVGVLAIVAGAVGDRIGHRRLLLIGNAGFLVGSVVAAFAPTGAVLILARVIQGVAGATLMPSTLALITELFPEERSRQKAVAAWATCMFGSASFGPVVGGVLLHFWWWGSVFLLAVPVAATVLALGPRLLPEHVDAAHAPRVDAVGAGQLVATMTCVFTAIKALIPGSAIPPGLAWTAAGMAAVVGAWFVRRQLRVTAPLLDLHLLRVPAVAVTVTSLVLAAVALAGTGLWSTQYLQTALGLSPLVAAIAFAPMAMGIAAGTWLAPVLANRVPAHVLVPAGLSLSACAELLLLLVAPGHALVSLITAYTLVGLGCGPLFAFGTHRVVSVAPAAAAGRAAALAETGNHLGTAAGLAALGTVGRVVSPSVHADAYDLSSALHAVGAVAAVALLGCAAINLPRRR